MENCKKEQKKDLENPFIIKFFDKIINVIFIVSISLLVASIFLWLYAGIYLPTQQNSTSETWLFQHRDWFLRPFGLNGNLRVVYPNMVTPGEDETLWIYLTHSNNSYPFQVEITVPANHLLLTAENNPDLSQKVTLQFSGIGDESRSVKIHYVHVPDFGILGTQSLQIRLVGMPWYLFPFTRAVLNIEIETAFEKVLLDLQGTKLEDSSPMLLIITMLVALGSFIYNNTIKKAEIEKIEASTVKDNFLKSIRENRIDDGINYYQELVSGRLRPYFDTIFLAAAEKWFVLVNSRNEVDPFSLYDLANLGMDEMACAALHVMENKLFNQGEMRNFVRSFPTDRCSGPISKLLEEKRVFYKKPINPAQGISVWPIPLASQGKNEIVSDSSYPSFFAEQELSNLFRHENPLFWREHLLYQELSKNLTYKVLQKQRDQGIGELPTTFTLCTGMTGSGLTSLALATSRYFEQSPHFMGLYLHGLPDDDDIRQGFGSQLMDFIHYYPSFLSLLGVAQRTLLADVLLGITSKRFLLEWLDQAISHDHLWLNDIDEKLQPIVQKQTKTDLQLLYRVIEDSSVESLPFSNWGRAFTEVVRVLEFEKLRLNIDFDTVKPPENYSRHLHLETEWLRKYVHISLFIHLEKLDDWMLPQPVFPMLTKLRLYELIWKSTDLKNFITYRWKNALRTEINESISEGKLVEICNTAPTPRAVLQILQPLILASENKA